jgi:hypothetical protein
MSEYSYFLFARPSFVEGMARVLDFGDTLSEYNQSLTPREADYLALKSDWAAVGEDLWRAFDAIESEMGASLAHAQRER